LPGKSKGTGASGSRDVNFSPAETSRRSRGVGKSSRAARGGDSVMMGASEVTELAAVEEAVNGPARRDSELGGSVSVGDEDNVDIGAPTQSMLKSID
jgi:hypothetical protein